MYSERDWRRARPAIAVALLALFALALAADSVEAGGPTGGGGWIGRTINKQKAQEKQVQKPPPPAKSAPRSGGDSKQAAAAGGGGFGISSASGGGGFSLAPVMSGALGDQPSTNVGTAGRESTGAVR